MAIGEGQERQETRGEKREGGKRRRVCERNPGRKKEGEEEREMWSTETAIDEREERNAWQSRRCHGFPRKRGREERRKKGCKRGEEREGGGDLSGILFISNCCEIESSFK